MHPAYRQVCVCAKFSMFTEVVQPAGICAEAKYLWAGMLQAVPTSRQSGAPSSAASRLTADLPGEPSSPSRLAAMLLAREADGDPARTQRQLTVLRGPVGAIALIRPSAWRQDIWSGKDTSHSTDA